MASGGIFVAALAARQAMIVRLRHARRHNHTPTRAALLLRAE